MREHGWSALYSVGAAQDEARVCVRGIRQQFTLFAAC